MLKRRVAAIPSAPDIQWANSVFILSGSGGDARKA
jgi:hypothetical protein